jgi:hypothetical protein
MANNEEGQTSGADDVEPLDSSPDIEGHLGEGIAEPQQAEPQLSSGVNPDEQYVAPLEIQRWEFTDYSDTNGLIIFNVPQSDGEHQVWINYFGPNGYFRKLVEGRLYKGKQWHEYRATGLPEGNGYYDTQWKYHSHWSEKRNKHVIVRKLPVITSADTWTATISGTGVSSGYLQIVEDGTNKDMSSQITGTLANWSIKLFAGLKPGTYFIKVRHSELGWPTRYSLPRAFYYYGVPSFSHLNDNDVIVVPRPKLQGEGFPGATVKIYESGSFAYGTATVDSSGIWSTVLTVDLPHRQFTFVAQQSLASGILPGWSKPVTVSVRLWPTISRDSDQEQAQAFILTGSDGLVGGTVEVFQDGGLTRYGTSAVLTGEQWSASVVVPPGPVSLVAVNVRGDYRSGRSLPRGFKVRPAQLVNVKHEVLPDGSIRIFGTGYAGAMVVFTLPGSTVTPPPDAQVLENGDWSTTATSWPYGNYNLQIVQKVGDGASGWIYSLPCDLKVEKKLPNVTDLDYTRDYQPTFSGRGNAGATVWLWRIDADEAVAPHVLLTTDGPWKSQVPAPWGPTLNRQVRIKQSGFVDQENEWLVLDVNIPPLAPGLNDPVENGLSPQLSGTCWWDAVVTLWYSDEDFGHNANVSNGQWTFRRDKPFAEDEVHTVTVTQFAGGQKSPAASTTFSVARPMLQPEITFPLSGSDVGRDVTISGSNGMLGASLQLWDRQVGDRLGDPTILHQDGAWSIELRNLTFRPYVIYAVQTLKNRPSLASELHALTVVVLPPQITQPAEMGRLPRCGKITGCGMPGATVQIFWVGASGPSLPDVEVGGDGHWEVEVELPVVGQKTIQALQIFRSENGSELTSEKTEPRAFDVVPAPPLIESPIEADHVGSSTVVSGFGVVGDTVTVTLNNAVAQAVHVHAIVRPDRTWSVTVDLSSFLGGHYVLEAVASLETFESFPATRPVVLGTFRPTLDEPAAGRWVSHPVVFAGQGRPGSGTVMSWYNPDVPWAELLPIADGRWRGEATKPLPQSGNWFQFWQILTGDPNGETVSARVDSERFEVEPARPALKGS